MKAMLPKSTDLAPPAGWIMDQKVDGHRVMVEFGGGEPARFFNRSGNPYGHTVPAVVQAAFRELEHWPRATFDGEMLSDRYVVFDVMRLVDQDVRLRSAKERRELMKSAVRLAKSDTIRAVRECTLEQARREGMEGVVIRDPGAPYVEGRTDRIRKIKFVETIDVIVTAIRPEGRDHMEIGLMHGGQMIPMGRINMVHHADTLDSLSEGDVVEIAYLYGVASSESLSGSLVQGIFQGVRTDKEASECTLDQTKWRTT